MMMCEGAKSPQVVIGTTCRSLWFRYDDDDDNEKINKYNKGECHLLASI